MPKDIREKKPDSIREILEELLMGYIKEVKINQALTRIRQILLEGLAKKKKDEMMCRINFSKFGKEKLDRVLGYNVAREEDIATIKRLTE